MADMIELQIIAAECTDAIKGEPDLEQRTRKAMAKVADSHWMYPGDDNADLRFRGALAAVLLSPETTAEEKQQIEHTLRQLQNLSALMRGIPVNVDAMADARKEHPPLPLMKWWHEARDKSKAATE